MNRAAVDARPDQPVPDGHPGGGRVSGIAGLFPTGHTPPKFAEPEKQWQEAHAAGETNAVSVLLIRNRRRDRSLAEGVIQGCNLVSTVSGSKV